MSEAEPWYPSNGRRKCARAEQAQKNVAGQHHRSKDGDPDPLPEFEFVTVN